MTFFCNLYRELELYKSGSPIGFPSRKTGPEWCNAAPGRVFKYKIRKKM